MEPQRTLTKAIDADEIIAAIKDAFTKLP